MCNPPRTGHSVSACHEDHKHPFGEDPLGSDGPTSLPKFTPPGTKHGGKAMRQDRIPRGGSLFAQHPCPGITVARRALMDSWPVGASVVRSCHVGRCSRAHGPRPCEQKPDTPPSLNQFGAWEAALSGGGPARCDAKAGIDPRICGGDPQRITTPTNGTRNGEARGMCRTWCFVAFVWLVLLRWWTLASEPSRN
eukprot:gene7882-biopygen7585